MKIDEHMSIHHGTNYIDAGATVSEVKLAVMHNVMLYYVMMPVNCICCRHVPDVENDRSARNVFQYRSSHRFLSYVSFVTTCGHSVAGHISTLCSAC